MNTINLLKAVNHWREDTTMTTTQTTHTPFSLVLDECRDAQGAYTLRLADGTANGDTKACPIATVYQDHNAAHIVHCVNTYPALLAALKLAAIMHPYNVTFSQAIAQAESEG